jgi:hypothetical protein
VLYNDTPDNRLHPHTLVFHNFSILFNSFKSNIRYLQMGLLARTFLEKRNYTKDLASVGRLVTDEEPPSEPTSNDYDVIIIGGGIELSRGTPGIVR